MAYSKEERYRPTAPPAMPKVTVSPKVINSNERWYQPTTTATVPKITVATSTVPKVIVSSNGINTDEGRYRPATTISVPKIPASPNVINFNERQSLPLAATTAPEITAFANSIQSSAKGSSLWEGIKGAVFGGAKKSLASDINAAANLYDLGQGGRDATTSYYLSDCEIGLKEAQRALEQMIEDGASVRDIRDQQAIVDDFQRKYDALSASGDAQRGATKAAYELADDVKSSAEADIAHAKEGQGALGQLLVDAGVNWTQTGLDAVKGGVLFGESSVLPLIGRKYGEHTQTARQDGADVGRASLYGVFGAGADAFIEKWFDGLNGIYGEKTVDLAEEFKRITTDSQIQRLIKAARNDAGEGIESLATDVADQLLKCVYNDRVAQNFSETEWDRVARNMLINTIVGIFSGDTVLELGR